MKTIKSKMYQLGHICRGIIYVGLRKNIKIKGGVVKKPISCRYAFPTIPLVDWWATIPLPVSCSIVYYIPTLHNADIKGEI